MLTQAFLCFLRRPTETTKSHQNHVGPIKNPDHPVYHLRHIADTNIVDLSNNFRTHIANPAPPKITIGSQMRCRKDSLGTFFLRHSRLK